MLWSVVMLTLFSQTSSNHWQLLCNIPKCSNDFCGSGVRNFSTRHKHKNIHLHMQTHATSARLQHHRPFISPHSPQVVVVVGGGANESWRIRTFFWRQGAAPPGSEPADRASHLGSREPATGPSIPVPCPVGLQPARQTGSAGGDKISWLARQAGACFDDSSIQLGQKCEWLTLFNTTGWFQSRSLTGHRCIPTVALRTLISLHFHVNMSLFFTVL